MSYSAGLVDPNQLAQRITSNIQKITQCSAEIQRILNQLGTPQDTHELRQQLQQKQQYTNQLAKETDKYIKEFGSLPATSEQRQKKIQKDRLVGEFTTALTNFQRLQRQAAEKEKDFVARVRASSRISGGAPEDSYKEGTLVSWDSQPQAQVQDEEITEDDLRLIEERESSIRQLEVGITSILVRTSIRAIRTFELFFDLLVQFSVNFFFLSPCLQQRSRKKMCILIGILAIGALILGIFLWVSLR
uniref:Syntaxin N-terminal domain-containing protein n=1 Tax=Pavo cristatus TaxID=9049 RepID=A0A8C9FR36_PAVCR